MTHGKEKRTRRANEQGLTIVELMISVLLAAMLTGGLFFMMSGQQVTYSHQLGKTLVQQNLGGTMSYMQRWVRGAGYGIGACPAHGGAERGRVHMTNGSGGAQASPIVAIEVFNDCNLLTTAPGSCPDGSGSDSMKITRVHPSAPSMAMPNMPSVVQGPPSVGASNGAPVEIPAGIGALTQQFQRGDLMVLWNPSGGACGVMEVTGWVPGPLRPTGPSVNLMHDEKPPFNSNIDWFPAIGLSGGFKEGTRVTRLTRESYPRIFAIDPTTNRLMTWQTLAADPKTDKDTTLEVVADQIEDMQISVGCDAGGTGVYASAAGNGNLDEGGLSGQKKVDEWSNNTPGDTPPVCGSTPIGAVRITLIARPASQTVGGPATGFRPAAEDRLRGPADRFSRSVLTSTMKTINLRM